MSQAINPQFIDVFQAAFREGDENVANKLEEAENVRRVEEIFRLIAHKDFKALNGILADDVDVTDDEFISKLCHSISLFIRL